jgi:hypothetical protein
MNVMPIRYCADVAAATRFYRAVGLEVGSRSRPGAWVELPAASGVLAIHEADADVAAGFDPGPILDEGFGRSMRVRDPEGVWVQINMFDRELYT